MAAIVVPVEEEDELVSFIRKCAAIGNTTTKKEVLATVEQAIAAKGTSVHLSNGWWASFRSSHPFLTLLTVERLFYSRLVASNERLINSYFDLLEKALVDNDLLDSPGSIFNWVSL